MVLKLAFPVISVTRETLSCNGLLS